MKRLTESQEFVLKFLSDPKKSRLDRKFHGGHTPTEIGDYANEKGMILGDSCSSAWACTRLKTLVNRGLVVRVKVGGSVFYCLSTKI